MSDIRFRRKIRALPRKIQLPNQFPREHVAKQNLGATNQLFILLHHAACVHSANAVTFPMRKKLKVLTNLDIKNITVLYLQSNSQYQPASTLPGSLFIKTKTILIGKLPFSAPEHRRMFKSYCLQLHFCDKK